MVGKYNLVFIRCIRVSHFFILYHNTKKAPATSFLPTELLPRRFHRGKIVISNEASFDCENFIGTQKFPFLLPRPTNHVGHQEFLHVGNFSRVFSPGKRAWPSGL